MLTWKVWAENDDLLFEGTEDEARAYVIGNDEVSGLTLESPDGDSYTYKDGTWILLGAAGFWGPNGQSSYGASNHH